MDFTVRSDNSFSWNGRSVRCALGRSGIVAHKREGDGGTPVGRFALRTLYYRPDRQAPPHTALDIRPIAPAMGWCDDPAHADYNRPVCLPHPASCETLWREDGVYDLLVVLGHNDDPPVPGLGSAIFLHLVRPDFSPTEGCVALELADFLDFLRIAQPGDCLAVAP